jgi:hypothetical protein
MRIKIPLFFLFLSIATHLNGQSVAKILLRHDESFEPVARGIAFKSIPILESDGRSLLYTADNQSNSIYVLSDKGTLVYSNERHGQGPGDLQNPWKMEFSDDNLFVSDLNGLSIFGKDLVFKRRMKLFKDVYSMTASDKYIFIAEGQSQVLISSFDHSGKKVSSFGDRYHIEPCNSEGPITFRSYDTLYHLSNLIYGQKEVYFISQIFGDIFAYSEDGRLLNKKEFSGEERIDRNKRILLSSGLPDLRTIGIRSRFFCDAQWDNGSIYALLFHRNNKKGEIWQIEGESLEVRNVYEFMYKSEFETESLAVMVVNKLPVFYLAILNQETGDVEIVRYVISASSAKGNSKSYYGGW